MVLPSRIIEKWDCCCLVKDWQCNQYWCQEGSVGNNTPGFSIAVICTYIYIYIEFQLYHSVNIYSNWIQEQFCNVFLYTLYILSVQWSSSKKKNTPQVDAHEWCEDTRRVDNRKCSNISKGWRLMPKKLEFQMERISFVHYVLLSASRFIWKFIFWLYIQFRL